MKLLHTSDWHLGRSFHGVGLLGAQAEYVDHLVEVVRSEGVAAVLVSGDVYDRALPSPDAVALLSDVVTRVIDAGAQVVLSSGNHDSAIRLGFASDLLSRAGLHIRCEVSSVGRPVLLDDAAVYPLPYLEPAAATVTDELGVERRTHEAVLGAAARAHQGAPHRCCRNDARVHPPLRASSASDETATTRPTCLKCSAQRRRPRARPDPPSPCRPASRDGSAPATR